MDGGREVIEEVREAFVCDTFGEDTREEVGGKAEEGAGHVISCCGVLPFGLQRAGGKFFFPLGGTGVAKCVCDLYSHGDQRIANGREVRLFTKLLRVCKDPSSQTQCNASWED